MTRSHDPSLTESTAGRVYALLIEHAGARDHEHDALMFAVCQTRQVQTDYGDDILVIRRR